MSSKGSECQRQWSKRSYLVRTGQIEPMKYEQTVEEAIKAAGIGDLECA